MIIYTDGGLLPASQQIKLGSRGNKPVKIHCVPVAPSHTALLPSSYPLAPIGENGQEPGVSASGMCCSDQCCRSLVWADCRAGWYWERTSWHPPGHQATCGAKEKVATLRTAKDEQELLLKFRMYLCVYMCGLGRGGVSVIPAVS